MYLYFTFIIRRCENTITDWLCYKYRNLYDYLCIFIYANVNTIYFKPLKIKYTI